MISTDDWAGINDAISRYCWNVDASDGPAWAALWTEDGVLTGMTPEPLVGRAALTAMADGIKGVFGRGMRHFYSNLVCDYGANKDEVKAKFYNMVSLYLDHSGIMGMAICHATFVRQSGEWKVKTNDVELLTPKAPA